MALTRRLEAGLRLALGSVWVAGIRRRNPGAVVNATLSLAVTFLPNLVQRRYPVEFRPWQRLYVDVAMLTHAAGMLGPYDDVWWWDRLTHVHSATIVGGVIHVVARRRGRDPAPRVVGGVFALGVLWEIAEYAIHRVSRRIGIEPLLVSYGRTDTILDLISNLVGAVAVVAFAESYLGNLTRRDDESDDPSSDRS